jgi:hypothetical protein
MYKMQKRSEMRTNFVERPEKNRPLGRPKSKWYGNTNWIFKDTWWEYVDRFQLAKDKLQ